MNDADVSGKPEGVAQERWWSYMSTTHSVPLLKNRLRAASDVSFRKELLGYLVDTCKINDDKKALAMLCGYVLAKHRNDDMNMQFEFVRKITTSFNLSEFQDENWKRLVELVRNCKLQASCVAYVFNLYVEYIHYRLLRGLPVEEQLLELAGTPHTLCVRIAQMMPKFEKQLLLSLPELRPKHYEYGMPYYFTTIVQGFIGWNNRHPEDKIDVLPYVKMDEFNLRKQICSTFYAVEGKFPRFV